MYDLQFETDDSYVVNGVQIQPGSPQSNLSPLDQDLYYDERLWTLELVWDTYNQSIPLNYNILIQCVLERTQIRFDPDKI